ncbi:hypothetical protein F1645_10375 [Novacetimonas hansenii]
MVKLFLKSFRRRRLFGKRAAPKNFYDFLSMMCFQIIFHGPSQVISPCFSTSPDIAPRRPPPRGGG